MSVSHAAISMIQLLVIPLGISHQAHLLKICPKIGFARIVVWEKKNLKKLSKQQKTTKNEINKSIFNIGNADNLLIPSM